MSSIKLGNNLDFNKLEIQNAVIQNLAADPGSPVKGQIYFNTSTNKKRTYNGTTWDEDGSSSGDVVGPSSSVDGESVLFNGTTGKLIKRSALTGIIKETAGVASVAVADTDYATPAFVNAAIQGVKWKSSVRAASTANGTLASAYENGDTLDGVTLATGDRILLKDQTTQTENGIYTVNASGAPTRATDADTGAEIKQSSVFVEEGTVNADKAFVNTNDGTVTLGSTNITYVSFVSALVPDATTSTKGKVALATQAEAEAKSDTAKAVVSADLVNFPIKKLFTIGNGSSTTLTCTHNLNTKDVMVQVRDASTDAVVLVDIQCNNVNSVDIVFAVAPASNAYKVVIIG